eukprot:1159951-Pelagomonas_calceolata.AAC.5
MEERKQWQYEKQGTGAVPATMGRESQLVGKYTQRARPSSFSGLHLDASDQALAFPPRFSQREGWHILFEAPITLSAPNTQASIDACLRVQESDLARLHNDAIKNDPFISQALGPNAKLERMRAASLRCGSQMDDLAGAVWGTGQGWVQLAH